MPVYEYRCAACLEITTVVCAIAELKGRVVCDRCGGEALRIISPSRVHLSKGSKLERLYPLFEAGDTFLYTPGEVTKGPSHVRDGILADHHLHCAVSTRNPVDHPPNRHENAGGSSGA